MSPKEATTKKRSLKAVKPTSSAPKKKETKAKKPLAPKNTNEVIVIDSSDDDLKKDEIIDDFDLPSSSQAVAQGSQNESKQSPIVKWIFGGSQSSKSKENSVPRRQETQLWVDKYTPFTEDELSIHKKKLADVRQWFIEALDPTSAGLRRLHKSYRLLALTGISGSAKTATVKFLSMELDFEIIEWINPINELQMDTTNDDLEESWTHPSTTKPYTTTPTLLQKFTDFITSARKTNALSFGDTPTTSPPSSSPRKVILLEDLPNLSTPTTRAHFHTLLQTHVHTASQVSPIVLILSDTIASTDSEFRAVTLKSLVPEDVRSASGYTRIQFNPIAPGILTKALMRVVGEESRGGYWGGGGGRRRKPGLGDVEAIVEASGGDIRCALNALQFMSVVEEEGGGSGGGRKGKKNVKGGGGAGSRDVNLIFYHALSKVLVGKRLEPGETPDEFPGLREDIGGNAQIEDIRLPKHLKHFDRKPLKSNPEFVFESSHTDADGFISYLAENYTSMFSEIEECVSAADYYSSADVLLGPWKNRTTMSAYAASIACRGTMLARTHPLPKQKFGSLSKPQAIPTFVAKRDALETAGEASMRWMHGWFRNQGRGTQFQLSSNYNHSVLMTEVIPFASRILFNNSSASAPRIHLIPQDRAFFQKMCSYRGAGGSSVAGVRRKADVLDETDVGMEEEDIDEVRSVDRDQNQQFSIVEEVIDDIED